MANVNIKFNNKDYLLSCDDGQEESLKKLTKFLDKKYSELKDKLGNIGENKLLLITTIQLIDEYFDLKQKVTNQKKKLDESHKKNPKDGYGISKLMMEKYLIKFCKENNLVYKIYRLSNVVGKNSKHNFLSNVLQNIKHRRKVYFSNPNLKFNNLIHVDNLKKIILKRCLTLTDTLRK